MNTTQLECFMSVSNFLNFSRAAEQLGLTQPAVSHQINALEDELGAKLFYRTSKQVRLTQEGHLFSQYAREILSLAGASRARLKESVETSALRFGIGCRSFLELRLLPPVLSRLQEVLPQLQPVPRLVPFDSLENLLEDGSIQVMFTFQETAPRRAVYRELTRRELVCVCAQDHPLAGRDRLTVQQLREEGGRFAAYPPHGAPPALLSLQGQLITGRSMDQLSFCDGLESLYTLVASGFAYAVIAALPQVPLPGLRTIPLPELAPVSYGLSHRPGEASPALKPFLAQTRGMFQGGET